ncbi:MAG: purine-nucleoside phosphorylase [Sphaerochaetaceae bacterium]|nr:purine-nucleoside phosphorylase [Sphaerochaetaceae bacterium]
MSTHISAKKGEIASKVILPGDPLRAKFIAENFLENVHCYNNVRGMLGFTGTYKGKEVSVQGTGMGTSSIGIYAYELMAFYGCKRLIRTGTCGSTSPDLKLKDTLLVQAAASDSGTFERRFGKGVTFPPVADFYLLRDAVNAAEALGVEPRVQTTYSADLFYDDIGPETQKKLLSYGVNSCEMECAELFTLGAKFRAQTLGILTVSDLLYTEGSCSSQEREQTFTTMMKIALEAI